MVECVQDKEGQRQCENRAIGSFCQGTPLFKGSRERKGSE